jgi:hypothetical protein
MKVITVWQPWASLIAIGAKPYEFRSWRPPASLIGQRIAIHAGARAIKKDEVHVLITQLRYPELGVTPCLKADLAEPVLLAIANENRPLPLSHIVCTGVLGEPKRGDECAKEFGVNAGNDSDRDGTFNWGWPLTEIEHFEPPIPARGAQGLWNWEGQ